MEVVPHWLRTRLVGAESATDPFHNPLLRHGEVVGVVFPDEPRSLTKRFVEYDVAVQHAENGTASTRVYHACVVANSLAGLADREYRSLRVGSLPGDPTPGLGSKVLILCVNGQQIQAVIVSGIRDDQDSDSDARAKGHHRYEEFNGVLVEIRDDGSAAVTRKGSTDAKGQPDKARGDNGGATAELRADGGVAAASATGDQALELGNDGSAALRAKDKVTVDADKIALGGEHEHLVLGDTYRQAEQELHQNEIQALTALAAACVPGSPLSGLAAGFAQMIQHRVKFEAQAVQYLSRDVTTK